jgi:hypothetical protein
MDNRLHCFNKLEELFSLYDKVRQSVILLENFNEEQKMYIAPINQLRSALDHIFKAINICDDFEQCEYELREAKEHLDRAGYDTMELLAANIGITIVEKLKRYDTKTITEVFPYYFTTIKPQLTDIKGIVASLRSNKKIDSDKSFSTYFDQIYILINIDKKVDTMIPSLEEYEKKKKKEHLKTWTISILSSIISGLLVGIIIYFVTK